MDHLRLPEGWGPRQISRIIGALAIAVTLNTLAQIIIRQETPQTYGGWTDIDPTEYETPPGVEQ